MIRRGRKNNGKFGWLVFMAAVVLIAGPTAAAPPTRGAYLTPADVRLRSGPGAKYEVVATIPKGVKINVVGREGYWLKVESKHGNKPGYIDEQYARPLETQPTAQSTNASAAGAYRTLREVDLREGPGLTFKAVTRLPAGIKVNV